MAWAVKFSTTMRVIPTLSSDLTGASFAGAGSPSWGAPSVDGGRFILISTGTFTNANVSFPSGNFLAADAEM